LSLKNNFDFLRLLAATVVLLAHQFALLGIYVQPPLANFSWAGLAVAIFFVISGYLVSHSWQKEPILWIFAAKRLLRLIPGLAFTTIFTVFCIGPLATNLTLREYFADGGTWNYLKNIYLNLHSVLPGVFLDNPYPKAVNASMWTLPIEANWYEALAVLGLLGVLKSRFVLIVAISACIYLSETRYSINTGSNLSWFIHYGIFFLSGALLSIIRISLKLVGLLAIASLIAGYLGYSNLAVIILLPIAVISFGTSSFPIISNLYKLGDLSYGTYLFAFPIQQTLVLFWGQNLSLHALACISILVTYILAYISWRFVELPALRLKKLLH